MNADDIRRLHGNLFVFDLEWIGDITENRTQCHIWDVGCVHVATGKTFARCALPSLAGENISELHGGVSCVPPVTRSMILQSNHASLSTVMRSWICWVNGTCTDRSSPRVLIAHNCFRADALVLSEEMHRCGEATHMGNVVFMDSLLHVRHALRGVQVNGYGLAALCNSLSVDQPSEPHRALHDATALLSVLSACKQQRNCELVSGLGMPFGKVSLTVADGVGVGMAVRIGEFTGATDLWALREMLFDKFGDATADECSELLRPLLADARLGQLCGNIVDAFRVLSI